MFLSFRKELFFNVKQLENVFNYSALRVIMVFCITLKHDNHRSNQCNTAL